MATDTTFKAGLEDVVANTSEICFVDGKEGRLIYQGYDIHDLVGGGASFEEVVYLLWHGKLPSKAELETFTKQIATQRELPEAVLNFLRGVPKDANAMEVLRTAVSYLGLYDPDNGDESIEANIRKATRLVAQIPTIVTSFERIRQGLEPIQPDPSLSAAASFFYQLRGEKPSEFVERAFNTALILHADHELNASTFSARVTAGTLSDMYSAITSAVGTLKGPLHGGANEQVMKMLLEINEESKAQEWIKTALDNKRKIMGFGHRVYRTEDPRATHLRKLSKEAGELAGQTKWFNMSQTIEAYVKETKGLNANVDFYSASMYYAMGIPTHLYTPIFAISRISGWSAHVLEQYRNNRLIRPRAEYVGKVNQTYVPVDQR
ncbi:citrate synthase [Alicyclobacillus acidoterrestris]|uniref:Citrate synthase n=1 Tax=Alicyclobacillus acidoterrestris (strain ATCC 49025 / DSM 3922 / CIP 106132 / NCIMB 13137 / GD3B) TaxID=1356854 RepID=T0D0N1_ALIAG|nr:citrate synthase [Alicyclobacillus acidoterrestris]EPZ45062.1 citrate synthase [Alicyclobacillus acidoterrestris ATCC 49025]UNO48351.1 citrate synthase [Alicyclobacillus acidoterrestris]GEO24374.1 citrate synthase 2 [Alicyclobacillus acidoterrestris]